MCSDCGRLLDWLPGERLLVLPAPGRLRTVDSRSGAATDLVNNPAYTFGTARRAPNGRWLAAVGTLGAGPRVVAIPLRAASIAPESEWVTVVDSPAAGWPQWPADGRLVYFVSGRDGFRCLWAQRVDADSKRPQGEPFAVYHVHTPGNPAPGPRRRVFMYAVRATRLVLDIQQQASNFWLADLEER